MHVSFETTTCVEHKFLCDSSMLNRPRAKTLLLGSPVRAPGRQAGKLWTSPKRPVTVAVFEICVLACLTEDEKALRFSYNVQSRLWVDPLCTEIVSRFYDLIDGIVCKP